MLTRAILTGGILSVLAGSIVYFGTEGADALESDVRQNARQEATELAGGTDLVEVSGQHDEHPHENVVKKKEKEAKATAEKPKKKWLDQYLKKSKDESDPDANLRELEVAIEQPLEVTVAQDPIVAIEQDNGMKTDESQVEMDSVIELRSASKPELSRELDVQVEADVQIEDAQLEPIAEDEKSVRVKTRIVRDGSDAEAKGAYIVSQESRVETIDIESLDIEALDLDGDIDVEKLKEQLGIEGERNVEVRVIKKKMSASPTHFELEKETKPALDYELVLAEAKKLMVTDMRNQAVLEIVDYAIDNGDIVQAADLVDELSTPELRDTARARIGTGLARAGKPDAAFAVLEALEIDELAAPIRLEIITALMATKAERKLQ